MHHFHALQKHFKFSSTVLWVSRFAQGNFADFDAARASRKLERDLLKKMIDWLSAHGAQVIEVGYRRNLLCVPPVAAGVPLQELRPTQVDTAATTAGDIGQLQTGLAKECPARHRSRVDEHSKPCSVTRRRISAPHARGDVIIKEARSNRADSKSSSGLP